MTTEKQTNTEQYKRENPLKCWYSEKEIKQDFLKFGITYKKNSFGDIDYFIYKHSGFWCRGVAIGGIRGLTLQKFYRLWLKIKSKIEEKYKCEYDNNSYVPYETLYNLIREIQGTIEKENEKRDKKYPNESYALYCFEDYLKEVLN